MKRLNFCSICALAIISIFQSTFTVADDSSDDRGIEEVIVTVERRETNLQDFAGTAVSISAEEIEMGGIINIADLAENVPGLDIGNSGGNLEVWVRGIGSSNNTELGDPAAAFHFNGVYIPRPSGIGSAFFDIARVEVNVGPQGTIRGRNAMAGSINAITWDPWLDNWVVNVEAEIGNYGQKVFRGVVNVPLNDSMAARLAVYKLDHDAYFKDVSGKDIGVSESEDNFGTRLSFLYEPNDDLRVLFAADYLLEQGTGWTGSNYANLLGNDIDPQSVDNPRTVYARAYAPVLNNPHWGIKLQVNYELGFANLEYIYGHRNLLFEYEAATPLTPDYPGARGSLDPIDEALDNWSFYQSKSKSVTNIHELRLVSPFEQEVSFTVGLFYFEEAQHSFLASTGDRGAFFQGFEFNQPNTDADSISIYSDLTWNYTDKTRFTVGLRFTDDHKERQGVNANYRFCLQAEEINPTNGQTNDSCQGARIGTEGFLFNALDRSIYNPDTNNDNNVTDLEMIAFYRDGIKSFGDRDTFDDILNYYTEQLIESGVDNFADMPNDLENNILCADPLSSDNIQTGADGFCDGFYIISGVNANNPLGTMVTPQKGQVDDSFVDWRLRVEHDINDDLLTYGLIATGHKSGGFNDSFPNQDRPIIYDTEQVTLYEIGFKNTIDLGPVPTQFNGSVFYNDYTDQVFCNVVSVTQALQISNGGDSVDDEGPTSSLGVNFCFNAADSSVSGVSFDGKFFFPWDITFSWKYLYLKAQIDETDPIQDSRYQADIDPRNARFIDITGNRMPRTAEQQYNFSLGQSIDLPTGRFDYLLSVGYRDDHYLTIYNSIDYSEEAELTGQPEARLDDRVKGYWTYDLGIGYNHGDSNLRLEGYINNATEMVQPTAMMISQDSNTRFFTRPKIYGFRMKWSL